MRTILRRATMQRIPPGMSRSFPILVFVLVLVFPMLTNDYWTGVATSILTFAMLGLGLNLVVGYAGLLDLGYAAFFAIGAYTSALLITKVGFNLWETIPFAMGLAALAGGLLGYPTLRLRSDYLAIVTLGFGEIVRITATNLNFTGGPDGVWGIPRPSIFGFSFKTNASLFYLALVLLLLTLLFTEHLAKSYLGRSWLSLREDESAAEAIGVPSTRVKLLAYVLGATWAGLAGAFFASRIGAINPDSFTFMQSVLILIVIVLGGMASTPGVLLGAVVVVGLPEALRSIADWRMFVFSVGLIVLMLVRPQGLWPASRRRPRWSNEIEKAENTGDESVKFMLSRSESENSGPQYTTDKMILEVSNLTCSFGGIKAVDDVNFQVPEGSILSIIGPNGAGKTTIFNCITGVIKPTGGSVVLDGKSIVGKRPHKVVAAGLARTFQGIRLFKGMAAWENVLVGMYPHKRTSVWQAALWTRSARVEERTSLKEAKSLLRFAGLDKQVGQLANQLSYGDQRRLEIARALASRPKLLLLDEPAAGMNPTEKNELMAIVRRIRDLGISIVLIEHDMNFIMNISDRIVVIDRGRKIADDVPEVIQGDPQVIAAYLGGSNHVVNLQDEVEPLDINKRG